MASLLDILEENSDSDFEDFPAFNLASNESEDDIDPESIQYEIKKISTSSSTSTNATKFITNLIRSRKLEAEADKALKTDVDAELKHVASLYVDDLITPADNENDKLRKIRCIACNIEIFKSSNSGLFINHSNLTLQFCGYLHGNENLTHYEKTLLKMEPPVLHSNIHIFLKLCQPNKISNVHPFLLFLLYTAAVNPSICAIGAAQKTFRRLLKEMCLKDSCTTFIKFEDFIKPFLNFGLDVNQHCPIDRIHNLSRDMDMSEKMYSSHTLNDWHQNLHCVLQMLLDTLSFQPCTDTDLTDVILFLLWISADRNLDDIDVHVCIRDCLQVAIEKYSKQEWNSGKLHTSLSSCVGIVDRKDPQTYSVLMQMLKTIPILTERGRQLQKIASYKILCSLLDCTDVSLERFELSVLLPIISKLGNSMKLINDDDFLYFIAVLIEYACGYNLEHDGVALCSQDLCQLLKRCISKIPGCNELSEKLKEYYTRILCRIDLLRNRETMYPNEPEIDEHLFMDYEANVEGDFSMLDHDMKSPIKQKRKRAYADISKDIASNIVSSDSEISVMEANLNELTITEKSKEETIVKRNELTITKKDKEEVIVKENYSSATISFVKNAHSTHTIIAEDNDNFINNIGSERNTNRELDLEKKNNQNSNVELTSNTSSNSSTHSEVCKIYNNVAETVSALANFDNLRKSQYQSEKINDHENVINMVKTNESHSLFSKVQSKGSSILTDAHKNNISHSVVSPNISQNITINISENVAKAHEKGMAITFNTNFSVTPTCGQNDHINPNISELNANKPLVSSQSSSTLKPHSSDGSLKSSEEISNCLVLSPLDLLSHTNISIKGTVQTTKSEEKQNSPHIYVTARSDTSPPQSREKITHNLELATTKLSGGISKDTSTDENVPKHGIQIAQSEEELNSQQRDVNFICSDTPPPQSKDKIPHLALTATKLPGGVGKNTSSDEIGPKNAIQTAQSKERLNSRQKDAFACSDTPPPHSKDKIPDLKLTATKPSGGVSKDISSDENVPKGAVQIVQNKEKLINSQVRDVTFVCSDAPLPQSKDKILHLKLTATKLSGGIGNCILSDENVPKDDIQVAQSEERLNSRHRDIVFACSDTSSLQSKDKIPHNLVLTVVKLSGEVGKETSSDENVPQDIVQIAQIEEKPSHQHRDVTSSCRDTAPSQLKDTVSHNWELTAIKASGGVAKDTSSDENVPPTLATYEDPDGLISKGRQVEKAAATCQSNNTNSPMFSYDFTNPQDTTDSSKSTKQLAPTCSITEKRSSEITEALSDKELDSIIVPNIVTPPPIMSESSFSPELSVTPVETSYETKSDNSSPSYLPFFQGLNTAIPFLGDEHFRAVDKPNSPSLDNTPIHEGVMGILYNDTKDTEVSIAQVPLTNTASTNYACTGTVSDTTSNTSTNLPVLMTNAVQFSQSNIPQQLQTRSASEMEYVSSLSVYANLLQELRHRPEVVDVDSDSGDELAVVCEVHNGVITLD